MTKFVIFDKFCQKMVLLCGPGKKKSLKNKIIGAVTAKLVSGYVQLKEAKAHILH
jgi:hypothetical protein